MAVAGRRSRRFVIVKHFMGNYNVPFPHGDPSVRPDTKPFRANIKAAFIRSTHKRRFTVLTLPYSYFFFFSHHVRFRWPLSIARIQERRRVYRVSRSKAICFEVIRQNPTAFAAWSNNTTETFRGYGSMLPNCNGNH